MLFIGWYLATRRCCRWWWGRTWRRSSCTTLSTGQWQWHDNCGNGTWYPATLRTLTWLNSEQDPCLCRQGLGWADQFWGVWKHHWQVGRACAQEDGGASLKKKMWRKGGWGITIYKDVILLLLPKNIKSPLWSVLSCFKAFLERWEALRSRI